MLRCANKIKNAELNSLVFKNSRNAEVVLVEVPSGLSRSAVWVEEDWIYVVPIDYDDIQ